MSDSTPGLIHNLLLWASVALVWLGGETGRVLVAAGLGGLIRWLSSARRRLRDGVFAVIGGAVSGTYLWPGVLWALRMDHTPDSIAMAAFVAGTLGMSFVKVLAAVVEARAQKSIGGGDA
ncbi:hypothetical protein [Pseudogemmobacter sonorensis]|uniref:hypothetical protein n=1 Tax=Pseudogemmobacter sonorensis TaxID=2989681 RepID=UPI0036A688C2